jgi:hypothetical protein
VAKLKSQPYHPEYGLEPTVTYVGLPKRFIAGEVVRRDIPGECAKGVQVSLEGHGVKRETTTDSYGDFEFEGLEKNRQYQVRVDLEGYASMILDANTQTDVNLGQITLEPLRK